MVEVIGAEVQARVLSAVEYIVECAVIADAQAGAERGEDAVLLGGHVIFGREGGIALVVVGPAREDDRAAREVEGVDGRDLAVCIVVIGAARAVPSRREGAVRTMALNLGLEQAAMSSSEVFSCTVRTL